MRSFHCLARYHLGPYIYMAAGWVMVLSTQDELHTAKYALTTNNFTLSLAIKDGASVRLCVDLTCPPALAVSLD